MKKIEIFEPAMCCPTGICGPAIDQNLIRMTAIQHDVNQSKDVRVVRRNLGENPNAFVRNHQISHLLEVAGIACLPVTFVENSVMIVGAYPTTAEMELYTGMTLTKNEK